MMFSNYNSLGFNNPYYLKRQGKFIFEQRFKDILNHYDDILEIDIISVSQMLSLNFMLGDRTIIKGISKTPWLAKPNLSETNFDFYKLAKHREIYKDPEGTAKNLYSLLRNEVKAYVGDFKKIGILLSGGMDSRMVAGILNDLILDKEVLVESVTGYTWGESESRDVVYSKLICDRLGWNFKHYTVTATDLWNNFEFAASNGCEYSGFHLHAIPQLVKDLDAEVLLAGSFGDSIGRAEYSGKHVRHLTPLDKKRKNFAYILPETFYVDSKTGWQWDLNKYHLLYSEDKNYQQVELDYQLHYMRRMLNPCIGILSKKCNVYQVFSSNSVFEYMWSLHPQCRTNDVYSHLLKLFKADFSNIPWARTGLPYGDLNGIPDNLKKSHHRYSYQVQNELMDKIELELNSGLIYNYVRKKSVLKLLELIKKYPDHNFDYLEKIVWLTSFSLFLKQNDIKNIIKQNHTSWSFFDSNIKLPLTYISKRLIRKLKN